MSACVFTKERDKGSCGDDGDALCLDHDGDFTARFIYVCKYVNLYIEDAHYLLPMLSTHKVDLKIFHAFDKQNYKNTWVYPNMTTLLLPQPSPAVTFGLDSPRAPGNCLLPVLAQSGWLLAGIQEKQDSQPAGCQLWKQESSEIQEWIPRNKGG